MKRSTGQAIVFVSAGTLIVASVMTWVTWVWVPGILELSHRGISLEIASVPTYLTLVAAGLVFAATLLFLSRAFSPSTELGAGVFEMLLAAGAVTPAALVLYRLSDPVYFSPTAEATVGLWLTLVASAGIAIGSAIVIVAAIRDRRTERREMKEEVAPPVRLHRAA